LKRLRVLRIANDTLVQVFQHGQTEVLKQCERPLVLLVHDEGSVRTLLGDLGINTAEFSSGLKSLLQ
jgi:predicted metal-binding protein